MFDRVDPAARKDVLNLRLRGYEARDVKLSRASPSRSPSPKGWPTSMSARRLENGSLTARITAGLRSARLSVGKGEERPGLAGRVDGAIRSAITGVTSLSLTAEITGTPEDFELKVRSDLDEVLKSAVGGLVRDQLAGFEATSRRRSPARSTDRSGSSRRA